MLLSRKKTKHAKVRTGCITCKDRKVKCTEEKPDCSRCVRVGQKCGGYNTPRTWLFQAQKERDPGAKDLTVARSPPWSCVLLPDETDRHSFDFYVDQTAPILSAYFGYSFWSKTLPQVSFHEPMIKEMVLATSSLVESNELRLSLLEDNLAYRANYQRVIRRMTSDKAPSTEYILMACLLLACCDFCVGEFQTGMQHIVSGVRILDEWYSSRYLNGKVTAQEANLILTELAPLFASVVQKIPTYGLSLGLHPGMMLKLVPSRELPHVPKTFSNIHQARHALDGIAHYVIKLMDPQTDRLEQGPLVPLLKESLSHYSRALVSFERQLPWTKRDRLTMWLSLLRAHHQVFTITVKAFPFVLDNSAAFESFQLEFETMLDEYTRMHTKNPRHSIFSQPAPVFCDPDRLQWHFGFIPPLFFVATKSSDRTTRLAAMARLRSLKVREKDWNSCIAATVAELLHTRRDKPALTLEHPLRDQLLLPECLCNAEIERISLEHFIAVSGYQGATMTLPANCTCETSP